MSHDATHYETWRLKQYLGREIPEEVAARTDRENEFPSDMWKKFGEAGYDVFRAFTLRRS